jgi:hypothetical protein
VLLYHRRLGVATVVGEEDCRIVESVSQLVGGESLMRRKLRKSVPFLLAIVFGTMAGALVAGVALLVSHS